MTQQSDLLEQLRIDRDRRPAGGDGLPRRNGPSGLLWVALTAVVAAAVVLALLWTRREAVPEVRTVVARSAASSPPASASILDASGYVVARRQATVSSKLTGKVVEVNVEEGQRVRAGDVLARLDTRNIDAELDLAQSQVLAAQAALREIEVRLADAERQLGRQRELLARQLVSQAQVDESQATADALRAQLALARQNIEVALRGREVNQRTFDDHVVLAPFDGVITVKNAQVGEMISPLATGGEGTRTGICTVVDMASLEIEVDVSENFINRVAPGQPVLARLNAYPDWQIPAQVVAVIPTADRGKATVKVRIGLQQVDGRVLPEMGARVSFLTEAAGVGAGDALPVTGVLVPSAAVHQDSVWVLDGDRVTRRSVQAQPGPGGQLLLPAGVGAGEVLVLDPAALRDGSRVRAIGSSAG